MIRQSLMMITLFVTSGCMPLTSPPSPLSAPAENSSPLGTPPNQNVPTPSRLPTFESTTPVQRAIRDLAVRLNIDASEITVEGITPVEITIPDTSCVPDQDSQPSIPAQAVGQEITLRAQNHKYVYHARGVQVVLCTAQTD
jgi:hypothetical protein